MNLEEGCVLVVDDSEVRMSSVEIAPMIGSDQSSSFDKALFVVFESAETYMFNYFAAYKKNRRIMKYFFGLMNLMV